MKTLPDCKNADDIEAWNEETSEVKRLKQPEEKPQVPLIIKEIEPSPDMKNVYNSNSFKPLEIGDTKNLDGNTAEKFRKGQYKIEARLDLHGMTEKQAFAAVTDFILNCYKKQKRCLLIITGKGLTTDDVPWYEIKGVIKKAIPLWLNNPEIRPFILSVTPAKQEDGGSGAMYVLLKRKRNYQS